MGNWTKSVRTYSSWILKKRGSGGPTRLWTSQRSDPEADLGLMEARSDLHMSSLIVNDVDGIILKLKLCFVNHSWDQHYEIHSARENTHCNRLIWLKLFSRWMENTRVVLWLCLRLRLLLQLEYVSKDYPIIIIDNLSIHQRKHTKFIWQNHQQEVWLEWQEWEARVYRGWPTPSAIARPEI